MPSDLEGQPAPNVVKGLIILAVVLLVETAVIGGLYFMTGRSVQDTVGQRDKLIADIERIDKETKTLEAAAIPAVSYAYQMQAAKETLAGHVYWSPFFAFLEKNTLPSVKYLTFSGDATTGTVTVDCTAGTYRDAAQQIVSLRESPMILEVRSNAAAAKLNEKGEIVGISFGMVIKVKPEAWSLVTAPSAMPAQQGSSSSGLVPTTSGTSAPSTTLPADVSGQPPAFQAAPEQPTASAPGAAVDSAPAPIFPTTTQGAPVGGQTPSVSDPGDAPPPPVVP